MSIALLWAAVAFSLLVICKTDCDLLQRGVPSLGFVVTMMYSLTYGIGWTLWRLDPDSLFGFGTSSTLGSLDRLGLLLTLGLPALVCGYSLVRKVVRFDNHKSFLEIAELYRPSLQRLSLGLVVLSVIGLWGMAGTGMFLRDPLQQQQALQASWLAKLLIGTGLLSRLAPVGLVLVPFAWTGWSRLQKLSVLLLIAIWTSFVLGSASRGQLLALPLYLLLGLVIWRRLPVKRAVLLLMLGGLLFLPVAESIRIHREGDASNLALQRTFETFQIGKQLMGTSHEFYLMLRADQCYRDLQSLVATDVLASQIDPKQLAQLPLGNPLRWHVVGRYDACATRALLYRGFNGFENLPLGLLPKSLGFPFTSLFDGQNLSVVLSESLSLKPGEISNSTISFFADAWWRWRWPGVLLASLVLGSFLGLVQTTLLWLTRNYPIQGFIGQLLVLSLVGSWINNTTLTMIWFLVWDLPKSWFELIVLTSLLGPRLPRVSA